MEFKDRVQKLRNDRKLTQTELASHFGRTESTVRMWETDRAKPDCNTLIKLAKFFNCTTDYLLGIENPNVNDEVHFLRQENEKLQDENALLRETMGKIQEFSSQSHCMRRNLKER